MDGENPKRKESIGLCRILGERIGGRMVFLSKFKKKNVLY